MLLRGALLQLALVSAAKRRKPDSGIDVGFCNSDGSGFMQKQPAEQMERWSLPVDNGTHLIVDWHPSSSVCGRNVSSYHVNVKTSLPIINMFVGAFGSFPQDLCAPGGSKAREAVSVQETMRRLLGAPVLWGSKAGARGCEDANKSK